MSQNIVITGCSSGLGLAFFEYYISLSSTNLVIGLDITPLPTDLLSSPKIQFHEVDITCPTSLAQIAVPLASVPIHLVMHCAGVRGLVREVMAAQEDLPLAQREVGAAETYQVMTKHTFTSTFEVNTWGTFNLLTTFIPNLLSSSDRVKSTASSNPHLKPKVIVLSSRMGSISANTTGGGYAYRASKSALNAIIKSFSVDVPDVSWCLLHPGRVETRLVEWKEEGAISAEESLKDCLSVIDRLGEDNSVVNGAFVDRFGQDIKW